MVNLIYSIIDGKYGINIYFIVYGIKRIVQVKEYIVHYYKYIVYEYEYGYEWCLLFNSLRRTSLNDKPLPYVNHYTR